MIEKKMTEVMFHQMRCNSGKISISEMEQDNQLKGVAIILGELNENLKLPMIMDKQQLHKFIGLLLHIQAKMK